MLNRIKGKMKGNKGFTLVELIVVIAIIGILLALAVPRLLGYTEVARETADEQLMALYGNTFDVLLGSEKMRTGSSGATVVINSSGVATITNSLYLDNSATALTGGTDGTFKSDIQDQYINKNRKTGSAQQFKSKAFTTSNADGIIISITSAGEVTTKINKP